MDNQLLLTILYDYYGELLTDKQKEYFKDYYFENLSLSEMSENYNISRNAIHKNLKETVDKLLYYEDKLKLYEKNKKIKKIIAKLDDDLKNKILENNSLTSIFNALAILLKVLNVMFLNSFPDSICFI